MIDWGARPRRVIALGMFDGVHTGHGAILRRTVERAAQLNAIPTAWTFDTHPVAYMDRFQLGMLTTPHRRAQLMREEYGIQDVIVARFDQEMMHTSWGDFLFKILVQQYGACHVVAGRDHRFGYKARGDAGKLAALATGLGVGFDIIDPVWRDENNKVSSGYIRRVVAQGDVEEARGYLTRPHMLEGKVVHGKGQGKTLGFPTANLDPDPRLQLPGNGVYLGMVTLPGGRRYAAAINVGVRPTVETSQNVTVEAYLPQYRGEDFYGADIQVEFYSRWRQESPFASVEELRKMVHDDGEEAVWRMEREGWK